VCHQNIRGLNGKTKPLEVLLNDELSCDVLIITEHFLRKHEIQSVTLTDFDLMSYFCRPNIERGGSCIYTRSNVRAFDRTDYCDLAREQIFDVCAVQLLDYDLLVVGIYHSNLTSHSEYLKLFDSLMAKINDDKLTAIIMGDINIDLRVNTPTKRQLLDILAANGFVQHIEDVTRRDGESATILDHAYSNTGDDRTSGTCVTTHLSDHAAQRLTVPRPSRRGTRPVVIRKRVYSTKNKTSFVTALESVDWQQIADRFKRECKQFAKSVINILTYLLDIHIPVKNITIRQNINPWIDSEIKLRTPQIKF
jgi:hypothetical protein